MTAALLAFDLKTADRDLPWRVVRLSDIGKTVTGSTPPKAQKEYYGDDFPFVKPGELLNRAVHDSFDKLSEAGAEVADVAPEGSVLVSCIGNLGKTALAGRPVAFNQQINAVIPHDSETGKWIFYAVQSPDFLAQLTAVSSATTISIVNKSKFSALTIPWAPLPEQRRIVAEIEQQFTRLDAGVAALRRTQANLKRYRAAVLKAACEGRLVPTEAELAKTNGRKYETGEQLLSRILTDRRNNWKGRGKYNEPTRPDTAALPQLPAGWTWSSLDQLLGLMRNGISAKPDAESGLPILRISAVRALSVDINEARFLNAVATDYPDYFLTGGDILFTRYNGNPELVGVCGVVPPLTSPLVHPDKLIRCKLVPLGALPDFVAITANVGASRAYLAKRVRTTAGQAGISGGDLKGLPIPLAPLAEQTRIVAEVERRLSVVDELESVVKNNLQRATRLRQSTLSKAFSAELPTISKS